RHRRARHGHGQGQEPAAAVRRARPQLHVSRPRRVRSRATDEPRQAPADPSRLRRRLPPATAAPARRHLGVSVTTRGVAGALATTLAARRQTLPLDPPGWGTRTLGGIAATGAAGPLRLRYGTMRDLLLGVRFVQADGVPTWGGARVVKSVTGYDIPKLLVGSLGTLGILGELTLRLHPLPEAEATCLVEARSVETALEAVAHIVDSTVQPHRLELLDAGALAACGLPAAAAGLVVSVGSVEAAVRAQQATIAAEAA